MSVTQWGIWKPQSNDNVVGDTLSTLYYPIKFPTNAFVFLPNIQSTHLGTVYPIYWFAHEVTTSYAKLYTTNMKWIAFGN